MNSIPPLFFYLFTLVNTQMSNRLFKERSFKTFQNLAEERDCEPRFRIVSFSACSSVPQMPAQQDARLAQQSSCRSKKGFWQNLTSPASDLPDVESTPRLRHQDLSQRFQTHEFDWICIFANVRCTMRSIFRAEAAGSANANFSGSVNFNDILYLSKTVLRCFTLFRLQIIYKLLIECPLTVTCW